MILNSPRLIDMMQSLNPPYGKREKREAEKLCSGQTLLCRFVDRNYSSYCTRGVLKEKYKKAGIDYFFIPK